VNEAINKKKRREAEEHVWNTPLEGTLKEGTELLMRIPIGPTRGQPGGHPPEDTPSGHP
jgi:hypothetical protein